MRSRRRRGSDRPLPNPFRTSHWTPERYLHALCRDPRFPFSTRLPFVTCVFQDPKRTPIPPSSVCSGSADWEGRQAFSPSLSLSLSNRPPSRSRSLRTWHPKEAHLLPHRCSLWLHPPSILPTPIACLYHVNPHCSPSRTVHTTTTTALLHLCISYCCYCYCSCYWLCSTRKRARLFSLSSRPLSPPSPTTNLTIASVDFRTMRHCGVLA
ncbi:hypothetical protein K431DRAFT_105027 [Polychaeton citri CBS 116435]|uniref:Uncharacterized protein n=1 Tax=Polychaeton citri CBS 116435 TaxID=1314669 RepID=A0A9P4Q5S4_9PEZI|nr:hypothetical protein K431DRAFT_105027 [Polychaeton citri CBS 116435]